MLVPRIKRSEDSSPTADSAVQSAAARISDIILALEGVYGPVVIVDRGRPVDVLIETVLSQNTSDTNSHRAFLSLLSRFGSLENVATARVEDIEQAISSAGLSRIKSVRIKQILNRLLEENGSLELDFLKKRDLDTAREYLVSFQGVGLKTASCVLLFSLGIPAMPVDTHVHRVAQRLGLLARRVGAAAAHAVLESLVPAADRYRFHLLLIEHGRRTCHSRNPKCNVCALKQMCPSAQ